MHAATEKEHHWVAFTNYSERFYFQDDKGFFTLMESATARLSKEVQRVLFRNFHGTKWKLLKTWCNSFNHWPTSQKARNWCLTIDGEADHKHSNHWCTLDQVYRILSISVSLHTPSSKNLQEERVCQTVSQGFAQSNNLVVMYKV